MNAPRAQSSKKKNSDLVDSLRANWRDEAPQLDTGAIEVVGRVTRLAALWDQQVNQALQPLDLSYTDFDIIATLRRTGSPFELLPTQLCDSILLTSGAMTNALMRLEKKSLVKRRVSKQDRRQKFVRLTSAGVRKADAAAKLRFRVAQEQIESLSGRDAEKLASLLKLLTLSFEPN